MLRGFGRVSTPLRLYTCDISRRMLVRISAGVLNNESEWAARNYNEGVVAPDALSLGFPSLTEVVAPDTLSFGFSVHEHFHCPYMNFQKLTWYT